MDRREALRITSAGSLGLAALASEPLLLGGEPALATIQEGASWPTICAYAPGNLMPPAPPPVPRAALGTIRRIQRSLDAEKKASVALWDPLGGAPVWLDLLLQMIRSQRTYEAQAARAVALLHVAMMDAAIIAWKAKLQYRRPSPASSDGRIRHFSKTPLDVPSYPSAHAAIGAAAASIFSYLYPGQTAPLSRGRVSFFAAANQAASSRVAAGRAYEADAKAGLRLGEAVGREVIARARDDGARGKWVASGGPIPEAVLGEYDVPRRENVRPIGPARWVPTPPAFTFPPYDPLAGNWRPWLLESGQQFRAPLPDALKTPFPVQSFIDQVVALKKIVSSLSEQERATAAFWADNIGTSLTPAGRFAALAARLAKQSQPTTPRFLRFMTAFCLGLADTAIATWESKYHYWVARPVTIIQSVKKQPFSDPVFVSPVLNPAHPAYPSSRAAFAAYAAAALAKRFPSATTAGPDGKPLTIQAASAQIARSRLLGGVNLRADIDAGAALGKRIASLIPA